MSSRAHGQVCTYTCTAISTVQTYIIAFLPMREERSGKAYASPYWNLKLGLHLEFSDGFCPR
jgi:hypothetical protein